MMLGPLDSVIERRLLVNYRIDPAWLTALLPSPFRPQLQRGFAVGGVCLLRLGGLRPSGMPRVLGITTENMAHRFAVEWDDEGGTRSGVFVPRRHTSSRLAAWAGGRMFPGRYDHACFAVDERGPVLRIEVSSADRKIHVVAAVHECDEIGGGLFVSLPEALSFFENGSLGYSPMASTDRLAGVRLATKSFTGRALSIEQMSSSVFDDIDRFPKGTCVLDSAIVMRDLSARWMSAREQEPGASDRAA